VQSQKSAFWNSAAVYPSANKTTTAMALIPESCSDPTYWQDAALFSLTALLGKFARHQEMADLFQRPTRNYFSLNARSAWNHHLVPPE
jgi:hypothetical protein